jgi:hypothetical protein
MSDIGFTCQDDSLEEQLERSMENTKQLADRIERIQHLERMILGWIGEKDTHGKILRRMLELDEQVEQLRELLNQMALKDQLKKGE